MVHFVTVAGLLLRTAEFDLDNSRSESEEEYEAYEENYDDEEAVALIGVSPPGIGQDGWHNPS